MKNLILIGVVLFVVLPANAQSDRPVVCTDSPKRCPTFLADLSDNESLNVEARVCNQAAQSGIYKWGLLQTQCENVRDRWMEASKVINPAMVTVPPPFVSPPPSLLRR